MLIKPFPVQIYTPTFGLGAEGVGMGQTGARSLRGLRLGDKTETL